MLTVFNWAARQLAALVLIATAGVIFAPFGAAHAKWPERPVRLILPFGPGGVADVTSRVLAERLTAKLGERVVIENMPGPGGIAAAKAVSTAEPDGYTLGFVTSGTAISAAMFKTLPFDPVKDFRPISMVATFDPVFVVNAASDYKTLADFIKAAKAQPGKLNIGTISVGGTQHLAAELFKSMANIDVQIVPYKNSPDIVVALLRNDVHLMVDFPPSIKGVVADNKARLVAVGGSVRSPLFKDIPTVAENGVPGYEVIAWNGIGGPSRLPDDIAKTMNEAIREALENTDTKTRFLNVGTIPRPSSPAEIVSRLESDIKKWNAVVDKAGIQRK